MLLLLLLLPAAGADDAAWDALWLQRTPLPASSPMIASYKASLSGGIVCANRTAATSPLVTACGELRDAISEALAIPSLPLIYSTTTTSGGGGGQLLVRATTLNERGLRNHSSEKAEESFRIYYPATEMLTIESPSGRGALFGAFRFISQLRREAIPVQNSTIAPSFDVADAPLAPLRIWQLWDNLDGTIERGYGGASLLHWEELPGTLRPRLFAFARLLASLGLNAISLSNVNACDADHGNDAVLASATVAKAAALASVFARFGIASFLTPCFSSPMIQGVGPDPPLPTADPLSPAVRHWWRAKVGEVAATFRDYAYGEGDAVNTFGGFLMKADSEGMPGPSTYNRSEPQGATLLADALADERTDGVLLWRAFSHPGDITNTSGDQPLMQWQVFTGLDGQWPANMVLQIKNGPMDFQTHEPVHSLFGQLPRTSLMVELGVAHEYTGQAWHLCHLTSMWADYLAFDTQCDEGGALPSSASSSSSSSSSSLQATQGATKSATKSMTTTTTTTTTKTRTSTLAEIVTGRTPSTSWYTSNGFAGVSNFGDDASWTGHPLSAANAFGFGRLAWNPDLSPGQIAREWTELTFPPSPPPPPPSPPPPAVAKESEGIEHQQERQQQRHTQQQQQQQDAAAEEGGAAPLSVARTVEAMLLTSWETFENYTSPFGLGAVVSNCKANPHFCPDGFEADFYSTSGKYDHYWLNLSLWQYALKECDSETGACSGNAGYGGGFNLSTPARALGNDRALAYGATYCGGNAAAFATPETTPNRLLLTFHHLPWNSTAFYGSADGSSSSSSSSSSGEQPPLVQAIYEAYAAGVAGAGAFVDTWGALQSSRSPANRRFAQTDPRYAQVLDRLRVAADDARNFSDAAVGFFVEKTGILPKKAWKQRGGWSSSSMSPSGLLLL